MRDYGKISPHFWIGATGRALRRAGVDAQIVALYLISSPHANMIGIYYLPIAYLAGDTGMSIEGASKGLAKVLTTGFAKYDEALEVVFVPSLAKFQVAERLHQDDKRRKGVENELSKWPKHPFTREFAEIYAESFGIDPNRYEASPFEAPSKPLRSQDQEQDQEQEQEQEIRIADAEAASATPKRKPKPPPDPRVDQLRECFARQFQIATGTPWAPTNIGAERKRAKDILGIADKVGLDWQTVEMSVKRFTTDAKWGRGKGFLVFASKFGEYIHGKQARSGRDAWYTPDDPLLGGRSNGNGTGNPDIDRFLAGVLPVNRVNKGDRIGLPNGDSSGTRHDDSRSGLGNGARGGEVSGACGDQRTIETTLREVDRSTEQRAESP